MASLTARGNHEIAAVNTEDQRFALRSDGKILRRFRGEIATGYSIYGQVRIGVELNKATLTRIVNALGYKVI